MVKLSRNDTCHCGSGKKYKKCCLEEDNMLQIQVDQKLSPQEEHLLTYQEINEFSTREIIYQLQQIGIPFKEVEFLADLQTFYSAEEIAQEWGARYKITASGRMADFPWLAAMILWERLAPAENLAMEQIDDLIERGNRYVTNNDAVMACDVWLKAWEAIKYRQQLTNEDLLYLEEHYEANFSISNFCQDLEGELRNAGIVDPIYHEKRTVYCQEFCIIFPEDTLNIHNMRRSKAESYSSLGEYEKAELEFEALVNEFPNNVWGYIRWGDMYFLDQKQEYEKAKALYEKALAVAVDKEDKEDAEDRLKHIAAFM